MSRRNLEAISTETLEFNITSDREEAATISMWTLLSLLLIPDPLITLLRD